MFETHPQATVNKFIWYLLSRMKVHDPQGLDLLQSNLEDPNVNKLETAVLLRYHAEELMGEKTNNDMYYDWPFEKLPELKTIEGNRAGLAEDIAKHSKLRMMIDKRIIQLQLEASYEVSMLYEENREIFQSVISRLLKTETFPPAAQTA